MRKKTTLNPEEEARFRTWYSVASTVNGIDKDPDVTKHHYDYRGYWKENIDGKRDAEIVMPGHFSDRWKMPGHETFSIESVYYDPDIHTAGRWEGDEFVMPGNKYDKISNDRYRQAFDALSRAGYRAADSDRLAKILAAQSIGETGWVNSAKGHNYAGYMDGNGLMSFDSPADFWDYHLANLSSKWSGWDQSGSVNEYISKINHHELGLSSEEEHARYNREHPDAPVYIYAPSWDNTDYESNVQSIYDGRVIPYIHNRIIDPPFNYAYGGGVNISTSEREAGRRRAESVQDFAARVLANNKNRQRVPDREKLANLAQRLLDAGYEYSSGGKIRIKPENRGKFTALKERTGHSATWFKENGTPAQKKMATFALNARHWGNGKADGGHLFADGDANGGALLRPLPRHRYDWESESTGHMVRVDSDGNLIDSIEPSVIATSLPGINTANGKRYARNMAQRVASGQMTMAEVPRKYYSYVEGEVKGAMPITRAIDKAGKTTALVGAATAALPFALEGAVMAAPYLGTAADALANSGVGRAVSHGLRVLANPAMAPTKGGAVAATAADAFGLMSGIRGLGSDLDKVRAGNYSWGDVPGTILDAGVLLPGSSQLTNTRNLELLADAGKTFANIPNITSRSTLLNRLAHPVETFRFSDLSRKASKILPDSIYEQAQLDLANSLFYNRPTIRNGYSFINKEPADRQMSFIPEYRLRPDSQTTSNAKFMGLGDRTAKTDWSRAHEYGHLVKDAAFKNHYWYGNYPPTSYTYGGESTITAMDPEKIAEEYFADVFANSISSDAYFETIGDLLSRRRFFANDWPTFVPTSRPYEPTTLFPK